MSKTNCTTYAKFFAFSSISCMLRLLHFLSATVYYKVSLLLSLAILKQPIFSGINMRARQGDGSRVFAGGNGKRRNIPILLWNSNGRILPEWEKYSLRETYMLYKSSFLHNIKFGSFFKKIIICR